MENLSVADKMRTLGNKYWKGDGVNQDYNQAFACFRKAADQGDATVQTIIGWMYENGKGVAQDYDQALIWYHKASDQGDTSAQHNIGEMYRRGLVWRRITVRR